MSAFELAQLNIAILRAPLDSPLMQDFVANLDRINALAESSPGFVWRLQDDSGNATGIREVDENTLVNLSVWRDVKSLADFAYRSAHSEYPRRRVEWFVQGPEARLVLWWVPAGHRPTVSESLARLERLRREGPGPEAFTPARRFDAPAGQGQKA